MSEKVAVKGGRHELHLPAIALRSLVVFLTIWSRRVGRAKSIAAVGGLANNSMFFGDPERNGYR